MADANPDIDWNAWRVMDADSELHIGEKHRGRSVATVIAKDFPEHGYHWVRRISRSPEGSLLVECSCGRPFTIP